MQYIYYRDSLEVLDRVSESVIVGNMFLPTELIDVVSYHEELPISHIFELAPLLKEVVKREALLFVEAQYTTEEKIREVIWLQQGIDPVAAMCRANLAWCDRVWGYYSYLKAAIYAGNLHVRWDYAEPIPHDFYDVCVEAAALGLIG